MYINFILPLAFVALALSSGDLTLSGNFEERFNSTCGQVTNLYTQAQEDLKAADTARLTAIEIHQKDGPYFQSFRDAFQAFQRANGTYTTSLNSYETTKASCLTVVCGDDAVCKNRIETEPSTAR